MELKYFSSQDGSTGNTTSFL